MDTVILVKYDNWGELIIIEITLNELWLILPQGVTSSDLTVLG